MIRVDLAAAGIPYTVDGKDYDFHALRHQFITNLALAGVSLKAAQQLARHSKPELTANTYTHLSVRDTVADVERLAPIPTNQPIAQQATGTDGGQSHPKRNHATPQPDRRADRVYAMSTQTLQIEANSGNNGNMKSEQSEHEKTPQNTGFHGVFLSDADGTRTRNHRIDSPVL